MIQDKKSLKATLKRMRKNYDVQKKEVDIWLECLFDVGPKHRVESVELLSMRLGKLSVAAKDMQVVCDEISAIGKGA